MPQIPGSQIPGSQIPGLLFVPPGNSPPVEPILELPDPQVDVGQGTIDAGDAPDSYGTVKVLPPPPNVGLIGTDEASYLGYGISIVYSGQTGIFPQPLAAAALSWPTQMIRTDTGFGFKTITAVATRIGAKPVMPSWDTQSGNDVLLSWLIGSFSPSKMPDGTPVYGIIVQYVYALQQPPGPYDSLDMGADPFDLLGKAANVINPADFVTYLVGPASPVTPPPNAKASSAAVLTKFLASQG